MITGYLRNVFTWYDEGLAALGHEPVRLPDMKNWSDPVAPAALLSYCRWLCRRALSETLDKYDADRAAAIASKQGRTINKCVVELEAANRLLWKMVLAQGFIKGVCEAMGLFQDEAAKARWEALVPPKPRPAVCRVLLVAEVEVEDPGFASDYILEAVAALAAAGVPSVRKVETAAHPELKKYFVPQLAIAPLTRPDGTVLPLSYSLDDGGHDDEADRP